MGLHGVGGVACLRALDMNKPSAAGGTPGQGEAFAESPGQCEEARGKRQCRAENCEQLSAPTGTQAPGAQTSSALPRAVPPWD